MKMYDSATVPSDAVLAAAVADGVGAYAGYTAAPRALSPWNSDAFSRVRAHGLIPLFVYVGTDGVDAVAQARRVGANAGDVVVLDIEAGWHDTYSLQWANDVRAGGFSPWLYGTQSECDNHHGPFDGVWIAAGMGTLPTVGGFQQQFDVVVSGGITVDISEVNGLMNQADVFRATLRVVYLAVGHREPEEAGLEFWTNEALAHGLDATIARMIDNPGELNSKLAQEAAE